MKPRIKLAESESPDGKPMILHEQDGDFAISFGGQELMHSRASASELLLGETTVQKLGKTPKAHILVGGLGLGFSLRAVLHAIQPDACVHVVELIPEIAEWNRSLLRGLNGALLDDRRVHLEIADVKAVIRKAHPNTYDAILLDVDNGPRGMVRDSNNSLYSRKGMRSARTALKPGGRVTVWSAGEDEFFHERMERAEFRVRVIPAKVHENAKRAAYRIYVGDRS